MTSSSESEREQAAHITGDYYWYDETEPVWWITAAVLCVTLPPVGAFLVGWFAVGAIRREESLDDGPEPAVRRVD